MKDSESIHLRLLEDTDPPGMAAAFQSMGWNKPEAQYRRYLDEQVAGTRTCFVATVNAQFAGYVTVNWRPTYAVFADLNIPEIQDLNVLPIFRRRSIASRLLDRAETEAARHSAIVGIGVGLHPGSQRRTATLHKARLHPRRPRHYLPKSFRSMRAQT